MGLLSRNSKLDQGVSPITPTTGAGRQGRPATAGIELLVLVRCRSQSWHNRTPPIVVAGTLPNHTSSKHSSRQAWVSTPACTICIHRTTDMHW